MVRAFMISFVTRQLLFSPRSEVAPKYPNSWLVWEPGAWVAPHQGVHTTLVPTSAQPERPVQGDALCFELANSATPIHVGRAPECEIVINDATVSRLHLELAQQPDKSWTANVTGSRGAWVKGATVPTGSTIPLRSGLQLQLGDVAVTYYDADGFLQRALEESKRGKKG